MHAPRTSLVTALALSALGSLDASPAYAQFSPPPPPPPPPPEMMQPSTPAPAPAPTVDSVQQARALFKEGVEHVRNAEWADALTAFERSMSARAHATTAFNVGACERAMGRYSRARRSFREALDRASRSPDELAPSLTEEARGFVAEIDRLVARITLHIDPPETAIAVDGRPVTPVGGVHVAGLEEPGPGRSLGATEAIVELNPGPHVFTLARKGYADAVVSRTFAVGARDRVELVLSRLPASLQVTSNVPGALVMVGERDVGPAPVSVQRPAGSYRVVVSKGGYEDYEADVLVRAGEQSALEARLIEERQQITKKWWFWTALAVVLVGGAAATYALTRPEPAPPPYQGGSTGWIVNPSTAP